MVPAARFAGWLDRVVDNKIIDGTVNGVGSLFALLSPRRPTAAGRPGAALRARHHRRRRRRAPLRRDLAGAVDGGLPDPLRHPDHAVRRRGDLPPAPVAPARAGEGGRLRHDGGHARLRAVHALAVRRRSGARSSSSRTSAGSPRSACATSSASTASASSWSSSPRCCSRSACSRRRSTSSTA